jgi:uncharacterized protein
MSKIVPPDVYVADAGSGKGLGVFAARDFDNDEIVEIAPMLMFRTDGCFFPSNLADRFFTWQSSELPSKENWGAITWGYGCLYNHDEPANMRHPIDCQQRTITYQTVRPVKKGEELTINYNSPDCGPTSDKDPYFTSRKINPVLSIKKLA